MGAVKGIDATNFPAQSRDVGVKSLLETRRGNFPAVAVRRDRDEPNDVIWRIDGETLPLSLNFGTDQHAFISQRVMDEYPDEQFIRERPEYCREGKTTQIGFHYGDYACEGVFVYDRGPFTVLRITSGVHEGRYISGHECQFKHV